jgi:hypothetical protein
MKWLQVAFSSAVDTIFDTFAAVSGTVVAVESSLIPK